MIYTEIEDYDTLIKCYDTMTPWQKRHDKVKISTKLFGKHHLTRQGSSEVRLGGLWQVSWHKFLPALYGWFKPRILWCFLLEEGGTLQVSGQIETVLYQPPTFWEMIRVCWGETKMSSWYFINGNTQQIKGFWWMIIKFYLSFSWLLEKNNKYRRASTGLVHLPKWKP